MKKYLVVTPGYPNENNKYNNGFVQTRVVNYMQRGLNIDVFSYSKKEKDSYVYNDVNVEVGGVDQLHEKIINGKYDKVLLHFAFKKQTECILKTIKGKNIPLVIWVHGVEALGWYRRLFYFSTMGKFKFIGYIILNIRQLFFMRKLIRSTENIKFIFVSEWMKKILEFDTLSIGKINNYAIVPNPIDVNVFPYNKKTENDRLKVLSIRPYDSKKYANDLVVQAILKLSKHPSFKNFEFTFYGDGKLFVKTLKPLRNFENVKIYQQFLNHSEISNLHKSNGIILIPTRQDSQGVSMCEAMSSGLVPITSNNTAIPEFTNSDNAYLTNNIDDIKQALIDIYNNPKKFLNMSLNASTFITNKCSSTIILDKEIKIIEENN